MEYLCIIITAIVIAIMLAVIFKLNPKQNKKIAENEELNSISDKFPKNIEICKDILKIIGNEDVIIEENKDAKDCLYIAVTNKIIISGTQNNFTRIQTIAHECLHSIQDRTIQLSNFIVSNISILYYVVILILGIFKIIPENYKISAIMIYSIISFLCFVIRAYLENDAMIKAKVLAKEYIEKKDVCDNEEIDKLVNGFEQINSMGIKGVNYSLFLSSIIRIIILSVIFMIR